MNALITGAAGFIGSHLVDSLLADGWNVTGLDNFDPFYPPSIKWNNIRHNLGASRFRLVQADICDLDSLRQILTEHYDAVIHLAAKPGVRSSISDPLGYYDVNLRGTHNLLESARSCKSTQFVFASSSSVYGINPNVPWAEDSIPMPISPYASSKVSCELLGHVYSQLFGIRFLALRFFTVYGPRQRPDLAIHKFTAGVRSGSQIPVFGSVNTRRDYTFVGDVISGIRAAMTYSASPYEVFNLGNNRTVTLLELIETLGEVLRINPKIKFLPAQPGNVPQTYANIEKAERLLKYSPQTSLSEGLQVFVQWFESTERLHTPTQFIPTEAA